MKLHEEANVEINDYGNDLPDVETFAKHLEIETNIIDAEQFNSIIYIANKGHEDKIYVLKMRNQVDVIKSLTAFYDTPYYCHMCKKVYTKRDKHKCPSKCLCCFTYAKDEKCDGNEKICEKCNRKFFGRRCFKNHLKNRSKVENKADIVCDTVKKCLYCNRIITGKYVNCHKCGYNECNNCNKYIGKNDKCFMRKIKAKGGYCMAGNKEPCKNNDSIQKRRIGVIRVEHTQKNRYFTTLKLPKTQEPTPLTSQSHKTSMVESIYTAVLRNSANVS